MGLTWGSSGFDLGCLFERTSSVSRASGICNISSLQHATLYQDGDGEPDAKRLKENSGEPASKRLYEATVLELVENDAEPGQWLAEVKYGKESFDVDSDCLVALEKAAEEKTCRYLQLEPFDWGKTAERQAKNMAVQCMDQAMLMVHDSIQHVAVQCLEGQGEAKPGRCVLRVVALEDFNPGHLMLTPYCSRDPESSLARRCLAKPEAEKNTYIARTYLSVNTKEKKKKAPESTDTYCMNTSFVVQSPLQKLQTKDQFDELSPLWALPKTTIAKDVNMELQMAFFEFSPMAPIACKVPSPLKRALFIIKMQVAVNKRKIKKGERLCLSMMDEEAINSDEEGAGAD